MSLNVYVTILAFLFLKLLLKNNVHKEMCRNHRELDEFSQSSHTHVNTKPKERTFPEHQILSCSLQVTILLKIIALLISNTIDSFCLGFELFYKWNHQFILFRVCFFHLTLRSRESSMLCIVVVHSHVCVVFYYM